MGSTILRRPVRIFHRLTLITTSVGGFLTGRGYPPSIELNSNSIFSGRESDATQCYNSIKLNHFWRYGNALKAQYRLAPGIAGTHSFPRPDAESLCLQVSSDHDTPKLPSLKRTKKNQKRKQKERKKNATPSRHRYRQVATGVILKN